MSILSAIWAASAIHAAATVRVGAPSPEEVMETLDLQTSMVIGTKKSKLHARSILLVEFIEDAVKNWPNSETGEPDYTIGQIVEWAAANTTDPINKAFFESMQAQDSLAA